MRKIYGFLFSFIVTLLTIAFFMIGCGGGGSSSGGSSTTTPTTTPTTIPITTPTTTVQPTTTTVPVIDGAALYASTCQRCHGALATPTRRIANKTVTGIKNAGMAFGLSDAQLLAIIAVLP
jgi:mono/diheme cytochrome c family protein